MPDVVREALESERATYTWWLYCRHATVAERRKAHAKVQEIDKLLKGDNDA